MKVPTIYDDHGSIRLRFKPPGMKRQSVFTGGKMNVRNDVKEAEGIAVRIHRAVEAGSYTGNPKDYLPSAKLREKQKELDALEKERKTDLPVLFKRYTEFKTPSLKKNSLVDFNRTQNKLDRCPYKRMSEAKQIMQWLVSDHKGVSRKTVEKQWKLINACCKWALQNEEIESNPFPDLKHLLDVKGRVKREGRKGTFTPEEMERIIKTFQGNRYYAYYAPMVEFIFRTGCRPSEAIALQWKHYKDGKIHFEQKVTAEGEVEKGTKTEERRAITIPKTVKSILDSLKPENDNPKEFIFRAKKGGLVDWHNFSNRAWKGILGSLEDVDYHSPYHMRHTAITLMIREGKDCMIVAKWAGNSPSTIAQYYMGDVSDIELPEI